LEIHYRNTGKLRFYAINGDDEKFWSYILQFIVVRILLSLASIVKKKEQLQERHILCNTITFAGDKYAIHNLVIKPTKCTTSPIYFWNKILHVSDSSSVHHQEFFTGWNILILLASCQQNLYDIYHCCV